MTFHFLEYFDIVAFKNKEIDSLYFFNALGQFALGLIGVFIPIYLFQLGIPIWLIVVFFFLRSVYYLLFGVILMPLMRVLSDKMIMALGIAPLVLFFLGLESISGASTVFYILPALFALYQLFTFIAYELDFSIASDNDHVGEEVGTRFVINALVKFATPFLGGLIIGAFGFGYVYIIASIILIASIIPLFMFPKRNVSSKLTLRNLWKNITNTEIRSYNLSSLSYGAEKMARNIVWPLFLFIVIGGIEEVGGIMSAGFFIGALISFYVGKKIDGGDQTVSEMMTKISSKGLSAVWAVRVFITTTIPAITSHLFEYIFRDLLLISWKTKFYQIAEEKTDSGLFVASQQFLYHIARVLILPVFGIFAYLFSQEMFFIASFLLASLLSLGFLLSNKQKLTEEIV